jgi:myosin heavy subunit
MAKSQEIAQIEEIYKGLTSVDTIVNKLSDSYLKIVKTIDDGTKSIKDNATSLDNLNKAQQETIDGGKKLDALDKQLAASEDKLKQLEDGRVKQLIANKIAIQEKNKALNDEIKAEKSAEGSLIRMRQELIKLNKEYITASKEVREKMAPAINKLNDEILKSEAAIGKHQRNVGNYPQTTQVAVEGFGDLTSAVGGTTGAIGNAVTSFATAGGAAGVFTAVLGTVAATWKRIQENIELYLTSADKLKFGFAGYEKDAEKARLDARRRAMGQINTGQSSLTEANRILEYSGSTEAQKEQAKLMKEQATAMIEEGRAFRDQVMGIKDKITWTLKYNKLLQEDEAISDEKLKKETEWEALEASLIKQRAIVSDAESTSAQKKQAAIDAEIIANKLVKEKTDFIGKQIANVTAMSEMTFTQEVVEDQINGLLREKNIIQKEYYSDQVKINKLKKASNKDTEGVDDELLKLRNLQINTANEIDKKGEKESNDIIKQFQDNFKQEQEWELDALIEGNDRELNAIFDKNQKELEDDKKTAEERKKITQELRNFQLQMASEAVNGIFDLNASKLSNEITSIEKERDVKLSNEKLTSKQKEKINEEYDKKVNAIKTKQAKADKLQSLFQIALDTFKGSMAAVAESPATFGLPFLPWVIAQGLLQAGLVAAQPIPKYSKGTKDAASRGLFGESGRELMFLKSGDIALADKPTYFEGSKFKGAKIYSNPETEKMIGMSDRHIGGYQITDERLLNELKLTRKAIENKPVAIYDKENRMIGQATSHSQTIYLNKLLHRN